MHQQMDDKQLATARMIGDTTMCQTTGLVMSAFFASCRSRDPMSVPRTLTLDDRDNLKNALADLGHVIACNSCVNGFWDRVNVPEKVALIATEVSEAMEALRQPMLEQSEKCPPHSHFAEELADIIIRVMDLDAIFNLELAAVIERKLDVNANRPRTHGGKRF